MIKKVSSPGTDDLVSGVDLVGEVHGSVEPAQVGQACSVVAVHRHEDDALRPARCTKSRARITPRWMRCRNDVMHPYLHAAARHDLMCGNLSTVDILPWAASMSFLSYKSV